MKEKIETEITNFCEECDSHDSCPENECVLFRIESIIMKNEDKNDTSTDNAK